MRQLFLPACLCLAAWSGTTNSDPRFTLDEFTGGLSANKSNVVQLASLGHTGSAADEQLTEQSALKPSIDPNLPDQNLSTEDTSIQNSSTQSVTDEKVSSEPTSSEPKSDPKPEPSLDEIATLIPDGAIETPVPSGVVVNNGEPAGIPLPPIAKPVIARSTEEICGTLAAAAQRNDLPTPFFIRLLFQESRFKPGVVSAAGAQGIAQFMPETAADMGVDNPFDPLQAIPASARLLRDLFQKFGNLGLAAAAYNAGPKRIQDWLAARGKGDKLPEETQGYVKTITGRAVETWTAASARHPGEKLPEHAPCQEAAGLLAWNGPDTVPVPSPSPLRAVAAKSKPAAMKVAKADTKADAKAHVQTAKADTKTETKTDMKAKVKIELKVEAKSEVKTDHKHGHTSGHKAEQAAAATHKNSTKTAAKPVAAGVAFDIKPIIADEKPTAHASAKTAAGQLKVHKPRPRLESKPERVAQR